MKKYSVVESHITDRLTDRFKNEFERIYREFNMSGKGFLIGYIFQLFKKWYYSALLEDTVLTPACVNEYCSDRKRVYPVLKCSSMQRLGELKVENIEYSIDNHPICNDLRILVEVFKGGIILDKNLYMSPDDIKKLKNISCNDKSYLVYLVMLGMDMEYIEKLPSVGVTMFCTSKKAKEIDEIDNEDLLYLLFMKAVGIASGFLSDNFLGEDYYVSPDTIIDWLTEPKPVDKIFEQVYGDIAIEITENITIDDMSEVEKEFTAKAYTRGVFFDKWFLTPFSCYFRFIDTTYMYEYSFYDEMLYLYNAHIFNKEYDDEAIVDSALYSPCTLYKTSRLGAEFFEIDYNEALPYVFRNIERDEILKGVIERDKSAINKIISLYEPDFDVFCLKFSEINDSDLSFHLEVKTDTFLNIISNYAMSIFKEAMPVCHSYRFYKLPESPFTEYTPYYMEKRGLKAEEHKIDELLEVGEKCFYEAVMISEAGESKKYTFNLMLEKIIKNEKGRVYPRLKV